MKVIQNSKRQHNTKTESGSADLEPWAYTFDGEQRRMFRDRRERTFRRDQCENALGGQFIQPRGSVCYPDNTDILIWVGSGRVLTLIPVSFPDTPHAITSNNLFKVARDPVSNLHKLVGEEQNVWVVVENTFNDSLPFDSDAAINRSSMLVDVDPEF